jgi:acylglycerol lipase
MSTALEAGPQLAPPTLVLYGEHDDIVPRKPVMQFIASLPPAAHQRVALYPNGYHMLMRDLDGATVIEDVAAWVADPDRQLPSGADRDGRARLLGRAAAVAAR